MVLVSRSPYAQAAGAHAADPEYAAVPEMSVAVPVEVAGGEAESVPDPLAGGLLAHLMSSVRGL